MNPRRVTSTSVAHHFQAAFGLEHLINRMAQAYLQFLLWKLTAEYRREAQYERARLMRQNPLDYRAVRGMDHELASVARRLADMDAARACSS
ncbi:MAG: hypothetical protein PW788_15390 [Micavibrio sp.]|nr:hypothetical protein [Micavibrio sp.]